MSDASDASDVSDASDSSYSSDVSDVSDASDASDALRSSNRKPVRFEALKKGCSRCQHRNHASEKRFKECMGRKWQRGTVSRESKGHHSFRRFPFNQDKPARGMLAGSPTRQPCC